MAAGLSATITLKPLRLFQYTDFLPKPTSTIFFTPLRGYKQSTIHRTQKMTGFTVCAHMEDPKQSSQIETEPKKDSNQVDSEAISSRIVEKPVDSLGNAATAIRGWPVWRTLLELRVAGEGARAVALSLGPDSLHKGFSVPCPNDAIFLHYRSGLAFLG